MEFYKKRQNKEDKRIKFIDGIFRLILKSYPTKQKRIITYTEM